MSHVHAVMPTALALALVYVIWGSTYLALRFAVADLPPWGLAGSRYLVAGLIALAIARLRGETLPTRRDWIHAIPAGLCLFLVGNGLIVVAEQTVPSSVAAVAAASTPLFASAMNAVRGERPSRAETVGMALGFGGVLMLMGSSAVTTAGWRGLLLIPAPIGFALGSLLVRARGKAGSALAVAGPQMVTGGAGMLLLSAITRERLPVHVSWTAGLAWLYLVVAGSLIAFTAYAWLLRHVRPTVSLSYAYVNPLIAVGLGALLGGERLTWAAAGATALIASGVSIAVSFRSRRPDPRSSGVRLPDAEAAPPCRQTAAPTRDAA